MKAKVTSFLRTYKFTASVSLQQYCSIQRDCGGGGGRDGGGRGAGRGLDLQFLEKGRKVVPKIKFSRIFTPTLLKNNEFDPLEFSVFLRPCAVKHCHGFHSCHSYILNKESI